MSAPVAFLVMPIAVIVVTAVVVILMNELAKWILRTTNEK